MRCDFGVAVLTSSKKTTPAVIGAALTIDLLALDLVDDVAIIPA